MAGTATKGPGNRTAVYVAPALYRDRADAARIFVLVSAVTVAVVSKVFMHAVPSPGVLLCVYAVPRGRTRSGRTPLCTADRGPRPITLASSLSVPYPSRSGLPLSLLCEFRMTTMTISANEGSKELSAGHLPESRVSAPTTVLALPDSGCLWEVSVLERCGVRFLLPTKRRHI